MPEQIDLTAAAAEEPGPEPEPEPESDPEPETLEEIFENNLNSGHGTALENSRIRAYKMLRKRIRAEDKDFPHGILGALKNAIVNDDKVTARTNRTRPRLNHTPQNVSMCCRPAWNEPCKKRMRWLK